MTSAELGERDEQALVVLVRPRTCRVDEKAPAHVVAGVEDRVVEAEMDRSHPALQDVVALDDGARGVLRDRDDEPARRIDQP